MRPYGAPPSSMPTDRPTVSELIDGADGRHFTVTFGPGQQLPQHRNASRVLITAVRGSGLVSIGDRPATTLIEGDRVQLDPDVPHAVVAGEDGLELTVHLIAGCCGVC